MDEPSNIFSKYPSGPEFVHEPIHFWPEVAVIVRTRSLPGDTKGLAREAAGNKLDWSNGIAPQFPDVAVTGHVGPVMGEYLAAIVVGLAERHGGHAGPLKPKAETADPGK
jgi:hypothetical protein